jgi:hypothetical protein
MCIIIVCLYRNNRKRREETRMNEEHKAHTEWGNFLRCDINVLGTKSIKGERERERERKRGRRRKSFLYTIWLW